MRAAAGVLIVDAAGRVLTVETTYKRYWDMPGGRMEREESPRACAQREVKEELGITVIPSRLLVVDYLPPRPDRRELVVYVFSCGTPCLDAIEVDGREIRSWAWTTSEERRRLMAEAPILRRRVQAALVAHFTGLTSYLESGMPV